MPVSSNDGKNSSKIDFDASQYRDDMTTTDQSGLIIFKHHKNKKFKNFPVYDRKLVSQSYESGLNNVIFLN